ncbi:MAG: amino acid permease, partial [Elusimicrobiota bacterium]
MKGNLFATKPLSLLLEEMKGENRLRRILGPVQLTSLGVGAIIGTGIFVLTGVAAHDKAGPALTLSFVVAGLACIFAALCYAEFASMAPVAGSAYTYAYATMGELFAWIIGWDLVLEYTVASATVAHGWSHYFLDFIGIFGIKLPHVFTNAPFDFSLTTGHLVATGTWFDLPAIVIAAIVTTILVIGIKESATFNTAMVAVKLLVVFFVIAVGAFYVKPENWQPFAPFGWTGVSIFGNHVAGQQDAGGSPIGMLAGAAIIFFAYIGFDS